MITNMSWYKQAMPQVWGKMASGIMFRHNGERYFLQERSGVEEEGTWGTPGGALKGTEGMYDSEDLPPPNLDRAKMKKLWDSALRETMEEVGSLPAFDSDAEFEQIMAGKKYFVGGVDNFAYVTFVVDLTDEQVNGWEIEHGYSSEASDHQWFSKGDLPENLHPGVQDFFDQHVDVSKANISAESVRGFVKIAEDRWTQGQVFIENGKTYDVDKLKEIVKDNKIERVKTHDLVSQLYDRSVWAEGERRISPIMVLVNPTYDHTYIKHMSRIRTSDLENPIIIRSTDGKVIDGYHRLTKAFILGIDRIKAYYVQEEQMGKALVQEKTARSFEEIRKSYDNDGHRHHLRLVCVKCGASETCRCRAPKTEEKGICYECQTGNKI